MTCIAAEFKPYIARFSVCIGDDYLTDVEGRVLGIMTGDHDPYYLVEVVDAVGLRRVGITSAVTFLRPAHDFTAVGHNLPEGSVVRTVTSCKVAGHDNNSACIKLWFDDSHLIANVMCTDSARMDELNGFVPGEFQDTKDLLGMQMRVDVVDGKLSFRDFARQPTVWRKAQ